ncbi:hypothetical protein D3C74_341230 [compost metagenome]
MDHPPGHQFFNLGLVVSQGKGSITHYSDQFTFIIRHIKVTGGGDMHGALRLSQGFLSCLMGKQGSISVCHDASSRLRRIIKQGPDNGGVVQIHGGQQFFSSFGRQIVHEPDQITFVHLLHDLKRSFRPESFKQLNLFVQLQGLGEIRQSIGFEQEQKPIGFFFRKLFIYE